MNQRKATVRFYSFEKTLEEMPGFALLRKRRTIAELQLVAGYVWAREGEKGPCPIVRSWEKSKESEYQYPASRGVPGVIMLGRKHRNLGTVLHELAHAMGMRDKLAHGPTFRKRCLRLYKVYGDWDGTVDFDNPPSGRTKR